MNIFDGSRRIAYLAGGLATAGTLIFAATYDPYISVDYSIARPRGSFQRMKGACPSEAARHYFTTTSSYGKQVSIDLCLFTMPFGKNNDQLVPYKIDEKNMVWGAGSYSSEVSAYERELESRFVLPAEDSKWLEKEISHRYWDNWKESLKNLGIGLAIFAGFVWVVGWITRGFMGIPQGMDKKPSNET
ncbi:hypothetical protein [Sulfurirhabdus autotrophica]|uniref:hypothetical protein n=1 Tax=Sulfurirhabdus autotrophica TaxID=1706046 RepID=UPI000F607407|nr:hypothetical protein [Sulfurirhabdus autotrophica]